VAGNQMLMAYANGYQSWAMKVKGNEDDLKIALRKFDDTIYLSSQDFDRSDSVYEPPHPQIGYDKYEEYLAQHIQYPPGVKMTGRVRVSFIVQSNGTLTDFKVVRKLHPEYDQEAIRVIRTGPVWIPSTDGRPTRARVDVRFK
jgi:TonB family protein